MAKLLLFAMPVILGCTKIDKNFYTFDSFILDRQKLKVIPQAIEKCLHNLAKIYFFTLFSPPMQWFFLMNRFNRKLISLTMRYSELRVEYK